MHKEKNNKAGTSSLIPHASYLKRKAACRFTLIELLVVYAYFCCDLAEPIKV